MTNIVFDIGGTNMRVAAARGEELGEIRKVPTLKDPKEAIAQLAQIARESSGGAIERAVGDVPSSIDSEGKMFDANNLPLWEGLRVADAISETLGVPATVYNDAVVVGYGEAQRGGGRGFARIAYLTVSTGVGGALVTEDLAHAPLLNELKLSMGDLEPLISGTAVQKKFGISPKDLDSLDERNKLADILAAGLAEIAEAWNPDAFVLGGSMIVGQNPIPLERVREKFMKVPVKMAELKDSGGLIGAALIAAR